MFGEVTTVNLWVILVAAIFLVPGLVFGATLLWVGTNAMLHGRGFTRDVAMTIAGIRRALRSIYGDTVRESLPGDFLDLLARLNGARPAGAAPRPRRSCH